MKRIKAKILAAAFAASMVLVLPAQAFGANEGLAINESLLPEGRQIVSVTTYNLAPGITESELVTNTDKGTKQNIDYVCVIDLSVGTTGIKANYKDGNPSVYGLQRVSQQAEAFQARADAAGTGEKVVGAVNANMFNMNTGSPTGVLIIGGTVYSRSSRGLGYFAILEDGSPMISKGDLPSNLKVQEAVSGQGVLMIDGVMQTDLTSAHSTLYTRAAIGISADGTKVITYSAHGRNTPLACGWHLDELYSMMRALGCTNAMLLDEGGSATLTTKRIGEDGFTTRNHPADGIERPVSGTLMFVSTSQAPVSPDIYTYTKKYNFKSGWYMVGEKPYYFDAKGTAHNPALIKDVPTTCTSRGYKLYEYKKVAAGDSTQFKVRYTKASGHSYDENHVCTKCGWHEAAFEDLSISLAYTSCSYSGKKHAPAVNVIARDANNKKVKLKGGYDYKVLYSDNLEIGTATVTIKPISIYQGDLINHRGTLAPGSKTLTFTINPAKTSVKSLQKGKKSFTVKWTPKKSTKKATGIQIRYSTTAKFMSKKTKTVTVKGTKVSSKKIKNLKSNTKYYVKIRTYKVVDGKKYYSAWSAAKTVYPY